jgi:hypothetical protein
VLGAGVMVGGPMEHYINRENILRYKKLLADTDVARDPDRHSLLLRLLAEEQAKDAPKTV